MKIERGVQWSAVRGCIHGVEGIGKTTFAAQWPNPVILDTEDGSHQIDCARVRCPDWATLEGALHDLVRDAQGFQTVVVDSADWMETHLKDHVCAKAGKQSIEQFAYGKGFVHVTEAVARVLGIADKLVAAGVHFLFVAHTQVRRTSPPDETEGYDRYELKLSKHTAPLIREWCDLMLFANYRVKLVEGGDGRMKARGGKERVMYAERSAAWDAKNRFGLPAEMPMDVASIAHIFASPSKRPGLRDRIAAAKTIEELGAIGDLVDDMASKSKLTPEQVAALEAAIAAKHEQLEPAEAAHG